MYKQLNKCIDIAYKEHKQGKQLREIKKVEISKEALDWFLDLDKKVTINKEFIQRENMLRNVKLNKNPMNINRVKFLFTLYIWTKIQENYIEYPYIHYLNSSIKKFKQDSNIAKSFSVNKEKNILYDLGYIHITQNQFIDAKFIRENEVFNIPITESNKIVLTGEELYNCGYWLQKKKYGTYICQKCKKEFAYNGKGKGFHNRKYCEDCQKVIDRERHRKV